MTAAQILHEEGTDVEVAEALAVEVSRVKAVRDKAAQKNRREEIARQVETGTHVLVPAMDAVHVDEADERRRIRERIETEVAEDVRAELTQRPEPDLRAALRAELNAEPVDDLAGLYEQISDLQDEIARLKGRKQAPKTQGKRTVAVRGGTA